MSTSASSAQIITLPDIPELLDPNYLNVLIPIIDKTDVAVPISNLAPTNPMMDALISTAHREFTENGAPAYNSTLSATLDAFQLLANMKKDAIATKLENAWKENPAVTLRIIWNLRSIHDGRGNRTSFYRAFGWLYDNYPRTAITNLHKLVEPVCSTPKNPDNKQPHGYWKDLLNILALATVDQLSPTSGHAYFLDSNPSGSSKSKREKKSKKRNNPEADKHAVELHNAKAKADAREKRTKQYIKNHQILVSKLQLPKYRALYITVTRLIADQLIKDMEKLNKLSTMGVENDRYDILKSLTLAGKWAPTPNGSHDRVTNIATAICMYMHNSQSFFQFPSTLNTTRDLREQCLIMRSYYGKWVLAALRKALECPEPLMSANLWSEIKYGRVPSTCMKNNTGSFFKHDTERFKAYLSEVESGGQKISGATLFPHELVMLAAGNRSGRAIPDEELSELKKFHKEMAETQLRAVESQWQTLINRLRESGSIENSLAVCDVSGSMGPIGRNQKDKTIYPIFPALALSLIFANLTKPPFNEGFISFSDHPQFVKVDLTKPLHKIIEDMTTSEWGASTNLHAVFTELLLPLAVKNNIKHEDMIKRLFIFTDMQFNVGCGDYARQWSTNYEVIKKEYSDAGYEVPQIVYWNLSQPDRRQTVETDGQTPGVAMMNGFSAQLLKIFMGEIETEDWEDVAMDGGGETSTVKAEVEFNPVNLMMKAVMVKSFDGLLVVD